MKQVKKILLISILLVFSGLSENAMAADPVVDIIEKAVSILTKSDRGYQEFKMTLPSVEVVTRLLEGEYVVRVPSRSYKRSGVSRTRHELEPNWPEELNGDNLNGDIDIDVKPQQFKEILELLNDSVPETRIDVQVARNDDGEVVSVRENYVFNLGTDAEMIVKVLVAVYQVLDGTDSKEASISIHLYYL